MRSGITTAFTGRQAAVPIPCSILLLCGGASRRFGCDKGLALFRGERLIERLVARLAPLTDDLLISTNQPEAYGFLERPLIADRLPGGGPLAGLEAGLGAARHEWLAVVACDLPFASPRLLGHMLRLVPGCDIVVPVHTANHRARRTGAPAGIPPPAPQAASDAPRAEAAPLHYEPLHAIYHRRCLGPVTRALERGERKVVSFFGDVRVRKVDEQECGAIPGVTPRVFENINTTAALANLEEREDPEGPETE